MDNVGPSLVNIYCFFFIFYFMGRSFFFFFAHLIEEVRLYSLLLNMEFIITMDTSYLFSVGIYGLFFLLFFLKNVILTPYPNLSAASLQEHMPYFRKRTAKEILQLRAE